MRSAGLRRPVPQGIVRGMTDAFHQSLPQNPGTLRQGGAVQRWIFIGGFLALVAALLFLWLLTGRRLVNPNTATRDQLLSLPAMSPEVADRILNLRPFMDEADFEKRVPGLAPQALTEMRARLDFDGDGRGDCCVVH